MILTILGHRQNRRENHNHWNLRYLRGSAFNCTEYILYDRVPKESVFEVENLAIKLNHRLIFRRSGMFYFGVLAVIDAIMAVNYIALMSVSVGFIIFEMSFASNMHSISILLWTNP